MKIITLMIIILTFNVFKILYNAEGTIGDEPTFPTLGETDVEFFPLDSGCSDVFGCIKFLAQVIYNIGAGIIFLISFIINLLIYLFELFALIVSQTFQGINGAPEWFNLIVSVFTAATIAFIIYRSIRSGETQA
jgi:hypothetical protein